VPSSNAPFPTAGWFVVLRGHHADLDQWQHALKRPFDPWIEQVPRGEATLWALRSRSFEHAADASEVRGQALPLIDRLNGALSVSAGADRVEFEGVGSVAPSGGVSLTVFAETSDRLRLRGLTVVASVEVRDADGNLIPPAPPEASAAQRWMHAAESDDDIADLLVYTGRADNWFDIYKAIELAERIVGSEQALSKLLGPSGAQVKNMRTTANFYRHARKYRPPVLTTQDEAASLLRSVVRAVVCWARPKRGDPCCSA